MKVSAFIVSVLLAVGSVGAQPVHFADANLQAMVENKLGFPDPTAADMLTLTHLYAGDHEIADLTGLQYATNLTRLELDHNLLTNLAPLASLTHLISLTLNSNLHISSLSPLAGLTELTYLNLHLTGTTNVAPLAGLTSLRELILRQNDIVSIAALSGLTNLEKLQLERNRINDLTPLAGLTLLRELSIGKNQISGLAPLAGLNQITVLSAPENRLTNIAPLASLTHLASLDLKINQITDISPLCSLTSLKSLWLGSNPLNQQALDHDIPLIRTNNPGIAIFYDTSVVGRLLVVSASAGGSVVEPGIGPFTYANNTPVRLRAQADPGFVFANWSGNVAMTGNPVTIIMDRDYQVRANFASVLSTLHVDDDAPGDPAPEDASRGDPQENGTAQHPFDSIQQAIEVAVPGDSILVHPGRYRESLDLLGKDIHLTGAGPSDPAGTAYPVLEGTGRGPIVSFRTGESPACTFIGFILTGGQDPTAAAIYCAKSSPTIAHCLIIGNRATDPNGAAVYCVSCQAVLTNCTITDNYAGSPGAGVTLRDSDVVLSNSILWDNSPQEILVLGTSHPAVRYCDVRGSWPDGGNLNSDPLFARPGHWADPNDPARRLGPEEPRAVWVAGDYHVQSQAGRWNPDTRLWVRDAVTSPCLDRGDPVSPVGAEPFPNGGRINLGVYGGTSEASKSY